MKSFMNMFMEKIKSGEPVFTVNVVENGATYYGIYCRKAWVDADIVFGCEDYDVSLSSTMQTMAIIKGDNVILIDKATYLYDEELPENVTMFDDVSEELEKELNDEYFYPWFDTIQAEKIQPATRLDMYSPRRIPKRHLESLIEGHTEAVFSITAKWQRITVTWRYLPAQKITLKTAVCRSYTERTGNVNSA